MLSCFVLSTILVVAGDKCYFLSSSYRLCRAQFVLEVKVKERYSDRVQHCREKEIICSFHCKSAALAHTCIHALTQFTNMQACIKCAHAHLQCTRAHTHTIHTVQPWGCFRISMLTSFLCFSVSPDKASSCRGRSQVCCSNCLHQ